MFEHYKHQVIPIRIFYWRIAKSLFLGAILILFSLGIGMWGYHHFESMSVVDSYVNAAMILSGMGPIGPLTTNGGKIFAGSYALFSGLTFIVALGVILAPIIHRFFHTLHVDVGGK